VDKTLESQDVIRRLEDAMDTTAFPCRSPRLSEIRSIPMRFGESEEDDAKILSLCLQMLK
jgi:hypothetical protein